MISLVTGAAGFIGSNLTKYLLSKKNIKKIIIIDSFQGTSLKNIDEFISTVKNIAPTFGGINLEDIKAPEAFEIERRLVEDLNIPVMHDDQHGTAIISGAALINALDLARKDIEKIKMVICGAGAAAISCAKMYVALGVKKKNIIMFDSKGPINSKREDFTNTKQHF